MPIFFLLKKCEKLLQCKSFSHFFNKKFSVFGCKVVKHLTSSLSLSCFEQPGPDFVFTRSLNESLTNDFIVNNRALFGISLWLSTHYSVETKSMIMVNVLKYQTLMSLTKMLRQIVKAKIRMLLEHSDLGLYSLQPTKSFQNQTAAKPFKCAF